MKQKKMEKKEKMINEILTQYFAFRKPLPDKEYIKEWKTTQDIQDELSTIDTVPLSDINTYMHEKGYTLATVGDGSLAWAIWRKMNIIDL